MQVFAWLAQACMSFVRAMLGWLMGEDMHCHA